MKQLALILIDIFLLIPLFSQDALTEKMLQEMTNNTEEPDIEAVSELIQLLSSTPLNINTSNEDKLSSSMLFSPFQIFGILKYREKYGAFFSIYELQVIPGFHTETLKTIASLITVEGCEKQTPHSRNKGVILSNVARKLPTSAAYLQSDSTLPSYPGSPLKTVHKLRYEIGDKILLGAVYEKDAGETWQNKHRAEHLMAYIRLQPEKIFSKIILGNYKLHRGLGLVQGMGFSSSEGVKLNGYRRSFAKASASGMEYKYYSGLYLSGGSKKWQSDLFFSYKPEDLSLFNFDPEKAIHEMLRETGIHRTRSEINGIGLAKRRSAGISINRAAEQWNAGVAFSNEKVNLSKTGKDSIPLYSELSSTRSNLSLYFVTFGKKHEVFGELAFDKNFRAAILLGGNVTVNPAFSMSGSYRHYESNYHGLFPNAYGAGDHPQNEKGFNIGATIVPFSNARLYLFTDVSNLIDNFGGLSPNSYTIRNSLRAKYEVHSGPTFEGKITSLVNPEKMKDEHAGPTKYAEERKLRFRFHYNYPLSEAIIISGRYEKSTYSFPEFKESGLLLYQQIRISNTKKLGLTYRYLIFNIQHWENRIYCYEPGVRYSFLFPAWYGSGSQNLIVATLKTERSLTFRGKIGVTHYNDKHEIGSGSDIVAGDRMLSFELQLEIKI